MSKVVVSSFSRKSTRNLAVSPRTTFHLTIAGVLPNDSGIDIVIILIISQKTLKRLILKLVGMRDKPEY
jgi:hypothetical protein